MLPVFAGMEYAKYINIPTYVLNISVQAFL